MTQPHSHAGDPAIVPVQHFSGARDAASPQERLNRIRMQARRFREEMLGKEPALYYRSFDLIRVPYPTRYALRDACTVPVPYVHILNRMFIVQFNSEAGIKTLLVSASDIQANRETPFFKRMSRRFGLFREQVESVIVPQLGSVESCLTEAGIHPEQVDYVTYDHLHTQDLRRWLGIRDKAGFFPNARLLVMRQEWDSAQGLLPPQSDWYCPGGTTGVPLEKVLLLDQDVMIGRSVALVRTPGHTEGNHSIVVHTSEGLMVTSENGVSPDSYSPAMSKIPGLKRYTEDTGMEVILNGNTLERGLDQYISMIQEREIAGPSPRDPGFFNVVPSSELTAFWLFPGIEPTFSFGPLEFGTPQLPPA